MKRYDHRRHLVRISLTISGACLLSVLPPGPQLGASQSQGSDTIRIAQYNVQFLFPSWVPGIVLGHLDHFPDSSLRANLIGQVLACRDIVSLNEVSNDARRADIVASMEANAAACGRPPLIDGGTRFWDSFSGPHNAQTDPILDDEIAIVSRFPIIQVHTLVYDACTAEDCLADKGALHARLWRGPGHHGRDAIDVFTTHLNNNENNENRDVLESQLQELKSFIQARHDPNLPLIVMGDFNIRGNPEDVGNAGSLYNTMMTTLRQAAPGLVDRGDPTQPTNMEEDERLDYLLVSNLQTDVAQASYFKNNFFDIDDDDLPQDGRLSDHAALLTSGAWAVRDFPPNPSTNLPREIRVEVSRLEEITLDTPDTIIVLVPFIIPTPFGPVVAAFPQVVGCDGLTDHSGNLQLLASTLVQRNFDEDHTFEGDDITPDGWELVGSVPAGAAGAVFVNFALFDDDDAACGQFNDEQDINPFSDAFDIQLALNLGADGIFVGSTRLAAIGEPIFLKGTDSDDRARATLFIETRYSSTADSDGDGLIDADEAYTHHTDPEDRDTDDDGLDDGPEINTYHTDPLDRDTDGDGATDGDEVNVDHTDPLDPDSDDDDLNDGDEITYGTDPHDPDSDDDLLEDGEEVHTYHTNPADADTDDDELNDGLEVKVVSTNPLDPDSDDDGLKDGEDVEFIENVVNGLPAGAFSAPAIRATFIARLEAIELQIAQGHRDDAILELAKLALRVDGCGAVSDQNDWIVVCPSQLLVRGLIELLAANLAS